MARPHIEPFVDRDVPFKKMTLPGFPRGMQYKVLSLDTDDGACSLTVRFEPGYKQPPGMSYTEYELFIMSGAITVGGKVWGPGSYLFVPAGVAIEALASPKGATGLMFYNYGEPSFVESDADHPQAERSRLAMVQAYDNLQWSSTNFYPATAPGCMVKILRFDPRTQAITFMYCMSPNMWQDNISYHDCAEEAYHVWGTSWMMQFGDLPTGGYFWRPPYINHGAFASKLGTLGVGRTDSQLYNHFHFNPWTNIEENRQRAASRIQHWKPDLYQWINSHGHNHPVDFEFDHGHAQEIDRITMATGRWSTSTRRSGGGAESRRYPRARKQVDAAVPPAPPPSPRELDERILEVVARIPRGRVATYGEIAARAGLPRGARRVGRALRNLPARRKIPWHRVINAQGRIALTAGGDSALRQRALLVDEGVVFSGDRIDLKRFGWTRPLDELLWAPVD